MLLVITNPRFRVLWASGAIVGLGEMVFLMAHGWLALTVTDSPFWVGATMGATGIGMMALVGVGGVLADRLPRRDIVVGSGLLHVAFTGLLAVPVFLDSTQLWQILGVALVTGATAGLRAPAYTALVADVVGRDKLMAANAANFVALGIGGVVAPIAAAGIVSAWGLGWAYVIAAAAELAGVGLLVMLSAPPRRDREETTAEAITSRGDSPWQSFKRGVRYVFGTPVVRTLILMGLVGEAFGWAHISMLPVMARDVLGAGVTGFGYLQSASFAGLLFATIAMSGMRDIRHKGRLLVVGGAGFPLLIMAFAASRHLPLSLVLLGLAYGFAALYEVILTTLIQTVVPDEMRGRVLSFQAFTWGVNGVSGFHTGAIAGWLGAPAAIAIGAGVMLAYVLRLAPRASRLQEFEAGD